MLPTNNNNNNNNSESTTISLPHSQHVLYAHSDSPHDRRTTLRQLQHHRPAALGVTQTAQRFHQDDAVVRADSCGRGEVFSVQLSVDRLTQPASA